MKLGGERIDMRKLLSMILIGGMVLSLSACSSSTATSEKATASSISSASESTSIENNSQASSMEKVTLTSSSNATAEKPKTDVDYSQYTIGIVQPGPEDYYQSLTDRVVAVAEHVGFQTTTLLSQYDQSTELSNVEDLITMGVNAIVMQPLTSASAQTICQMCNEANMPIFIVNATVDEGEGVPTAIVGTSFYDMGELDGQWLIDNMDKVSGDVAKVIEIQGALGQGVADEITRGFEDSIKDQDDIEIVYQTDCQWDRSKAIAAIEDQITAGTDFNVVFSHNEDMTRGVVDTLAENNLTDSVVVITQNGSDTGFQMLEEGLIQATVSNSPALVAAETVIAIMKNINGTLEPGGEIMADVYTITQDNYKDPDTITWDAKWGIDRVDKYLNEKS